MCKKLLGDILRHLLTIDQKSQFATRKPCQSKIKFTDIILDLINESNSEKLKLFQCVSPVAKNILKCHCQKNDKKFFSQNPKKSN